MGSNRRHVTSLNIIALTTILFVSCSEYSNIPDLFDKREYAKIESILAESDRHWEWYLWQNKLKIEGEIGTYTSIDSVYQVMKNDSTFKLREFKRFYNLSKYHSYDFISDLINLEDRFYQPVKSNYYYGELLQMLRSKKQAYQQYSIDHLLHHLDMSYIPFVIPEILNILDDSTQSRAYRNKLRNLASILEMHSDDKRLRIKSDSLFETIDYNSKTDILNLKSPILTESKHLNEFKMIHFHVMPKESINQVMDRIIANKELQYYLALSRRKINIPDKEQLERIFSSIYIDDGMMFELVKQLSVNEIDSIEQLMFNYNSYAIKSFLMSQIDQNETKIHFIEVYFEAFKIGSLQKEIEKRLQHFKKADLSDFVNRSKDKIDDEHLAFLLYWIGITALKDQSDYVRTFLDHDNLVIKSEAVQSLKRLDRI